ncbi:MAG: oligosaccharide flippase family protein, partial [Dehalococcoidia bacterium]
MLLSPTKASPAAGLIKRVAARFQGDSVRARFLSGAFWSLVGAVASRAPTLVGSIVAARVLGIKGFGELGIVQSTVLLFGTFAGLGLGLTATKTVAEYRVNAPDRAGRHIGLSIITTLLAGLAMALPFISLARWLAMNMLSAPNLTRDLQVGAGLLFFSALNGTQNGILAGFEAFKMVARVNVVRAILSLAFLTVGVKVGGVFGGILGLVGAEAAGSFVGYTAIRHETRRTGIRTQYRNLRGELPVLWTFSLPALLSSVATLPAIWIANVMLVRQPDGYAALGLFTAANKWSLLILFVPTSVANIVLPMLANLRGIGDDHAFRQVFHANILVSLACTLVPGALVAAFAVPIMALYGGDYRKGWLILAILALTTVPTALNTVLGQAIVSTDSVWWRFWFDVFLAAILF